MSSYFEKFPNTFYNFGNEKTPTAFQNIQKYSELIDTYRDNIGTYIEYEIRDGDRPDTVSQMLYGRPDYDWTFFLMNERLREAGWPLSVNQVYERAVNDYFPNYVARLDITTADSAAEYANLYPVGQSVLISGIEGVVVKKDLNIGELTVQCDTSPIGGVNLSYSALEQDPSEPLTVNSAVTMAFEYEGYHHYVDTNGDYTDRYFDASVKVPVTNLEHLINENEESKRIRVIKRDLVRDVVGKYKKIISVS